jgi:hypothetical protein
VFPGVLEPVFSADYSVIFQIALVAGDNSDRCSHANFHPSRTVAKLFHQSQVVLRPLVGLHIDHVHEVVQRTQTGLAGDIVDEEERIGFQIGRRPKTSIFFLTGSVGDG